MKNKTLLPAIIMFLLWLCACTPLETVTVTEVIDGDTIVVSSGQTVRYIGIDTPEIHPEVEPYGMEAWKLNRHLVEGREVRMERDVSDTDEHGRLLRYVYVDDMLVNAELVRLGMAVAKAYPPDTKSQSHLEGLEEVARESGRGMWAK